MRWHALRKKLDVMAQRIMLSPKKYLAKNNLCPYTRNPLFVDLFHIVSLLSQHWKVQNATDHEGRVCRKIEL